jgi:uncharacterized membrane protein
MSFKDVVEVVGKGVDAAGVAVMVVGVLLIAVRALLGAPPVPPATRYRDFRQGIGKAILLGLELLVAGDIIRTVAVSPTFKSAGVLAIIVGIRTFLSMSLEVELEGRWPWQGRGDAVRQARP